MPCLFEALKALCDILIDLGEYSAVVDLLQGVLPMALESEYQYLIGSLYALLAEGHNGQGNDSYALDSKERAQNIHVVTRYLDKAKEGKRPRLAVLHMIYSPISFVTQAISMSKSLTPFYK
ncbi:APC5 protein [Elasticomyces elasticus]|nr:APC5 protein [Elasticomyces elasticus]